MRHFKTRGSLTALQALQGSAHLSQLAQRARQSVLLLDSVRPLLPPALRSQVAAGSLEDGHWCLLVPHNAAASKIRQLRPALLQNLRQAGHPIEHIRIKLRQEHYT